MNDRVMETSMTSRAQLMLLVKSMSWCLLGLGSFTFIYIVTSIAVGLMSLNIFEWTEQSFFVVWFFFSVPRVGASISQTLAMSFLPAKKSKEYRLKRLGSEDQMGSEHIKDTDVDSPQYHSSTMGVL